MLRNEGTPELRFQGTGRIRRRVDLYWSAFEGEWEHKSAAESRCVTMGRRRSFSLYLIQSSASSGQSLP